VGRAGSLRRVVNPRALGSLPYKPTLVRASTMIRFVISVMLLLPGRRTRQTGRSRPAEWIPFLPILVWMVRPPSRSGANLSLAATGNHPRAPVGPSGLFLLNNHSRAIPLYSGAEGFAAPHRGNFGT